MSDIVKSIGSQLVGVRDLLVDQGSCLNGKVTLDSLTSPRISAEAQAEIVNDCSSIVVILATEYVVGIRLNTMYDIVKLEDIKEASVLELYREKIFSILSNIDTHTYNLIDVVCDSFEMLLTEYQVTNNGAVYTNKDIAKYMVDEALDDYFEKHEKTLEAVKRLNILEPAVGSGVYVELLIEALYCMRKELGESANRLDVYKDIIKHNIYAVDLNRLAVTFTICRLIMLVGETVEHNIRVGNTLVESVVVKGKEGILPIIDKECNADSATCWNTFKREVAEGFKNKDIDSMMLASLDMQGLFDDCIEDEEVEELMLEYKSDIDKQFVWQREFSRAYFNGGFDIVIGNPPYIKCEKITEPRKYLEKHYKEVYNGSADIYIYFYYRGIQLLKENGILSFITSNKWFRVKYADKFRSYVKNDINIIRFIDFKGNRVFGAGVDTNISVFRKAEPTDTFIYVDGTYYNSTEKTSDNELSEFKEIQEID